MKRIHWTIALLAVVVFSAWLKFNAKSPRLESSPTSHATGDKGGKGERTVPVRVTVAKEAKIDRVVEVTGSITARREVAVASETTGKVVSVSAEEGDRVIAGQVLVRLNDADARSRVARAQAMLAQAKSRLAQARTQTQLTSAETESGVVQADTELLATKSRAAQAASTLKLSEEQNEHHLTQVQKELEAARQNLQLLQAGARPQEKVQAQAAVDAAQTDIDQLQAALTQAETDVQQAQLEFDRLKGLLEKGFASQQQADNAKFRLTTSQTGVTAAKARIAGSKTRLRQAEERLSLLNEGARPEELAIAKARVEQSEAALREAKAQREQIEVRRKELEEAQLKVRAQEQSKRLAETNRGKVRAIQEGTDALQAGVQEAGAELALAVKNLRDCVLVAPLSGTVSRRLVQPGEVVSPGTPLLKLLSSGSVFFAAEVPESDISSIAVGQSATVTIDALPNKQVVGRVVEVLPSGEMTSRRFIVNIALPNARGELREGMFARGVLVVQRQVSVVLVPLDAVVRRRGKEFVAVVHPPDAVELREVRLGPSREENAEVADGLTAGETVVSQGAQGLKPKTRIEIVE